jgi:hypothetical protein
MNVAIPFELFIILVISALVVGFILGSCYIGRTIRILAQKIVEVMGEKVNEDKVYKATDEAKKEIMEGQYDIYGGINQ